MPKAVFCQTLCYQKSARVTNGTFVNSFTIMISSNKTMANFTNIAIHFLYSKVIFNRRIKI